MKISIKQLQVFVNTAKAESISIGAQKCFISQAAASMSLAQLENMLDITLFDRVGKRMKLNDNGRRLLVKAVRILNEIEEFESLSVNDESLNGNIVIGASTTIANYVLPKYIAKFREIHPETNFEIIAGNTKKIIKSVELLECDVGFVEGTCNSQAIDTSIWKKDNLKVICKQGHTLSHRKMIKVKDLLEFEWVTREEGSGTFDILVEALGDNESEAKRSITLHSTEAIKQYIANSDCIACLSEIITQQAWDKGKYCTLDVKDLDLSRNFYKLLHNKKYHTTLTKAFCEFMEKDLS